MNKLLDQKHAVKLDNCSDKHFISPIEITVRKRTKNIFICKKKHQKPNIEQLLDNSAHVIEMDDRQQTLSSALDLRYAHLQILPDLKSKSQYKFSLIVGNATGNYQFQIGFLGLTNMSNDR